MNNTVSLLRAARKWSQADLADQLNVSRQTVNAIETGRYDPSLPLAFKIAKVFDARIEEIFMPDGGARQLLPLQINKEGSMREVVLQFHQPSALKHIFAIEQGGKEIGALRYDGPMQRTATAILGEQEWRFTRRGVTHTEVVVTLPGSDDVLATYIRRGLRKAGTITIDDTVYQFAPNGIGLKSYYAWKKDEHEYITYANGGFLKAKGDIVLKNELIGAEQLLLLLGLFLGINQDEEVVL